MTPLNNSLLQTVEEAHGAMSLKFPNQWVSLIFAFYSTLSGGFSGAAGRNHNWKETLNIMSYHRNKMNEYLCRNYFANEIIQTYQNESLKIENETCGNQLKNSRLARESLLSDPGSQKYKDWLSRSSTLEDIYRQFEHLEGEHVANHEIGEGHEGEVTGYALVGHKNVYSKPEEFGDFHPYGFHKDQKEHKEEEEDEYEEKGLKLKELFHFALTAIAFLAFACFMIEVIICLMETPSQPMEPDYVLVPTSTGGTGHASKLEFDNSGTHHRHERSFEAHPMSMEILNAMSGRILSSIEALTILHEDNGQCFQRALCQNSKYSKSLPQLHKIWLPLWNFGMSWISRKVSQGKGSNTLEYLKAAVMGLASRDCHTMYPKCNRRKKRKK